MDPASLATLGAPLLHEAIKALVGLAGDALRSWRERRKAQAAPADPEGEAATVPATVEVPDILEGTPAPIEHHLGPSATWPGSGWIGGGTSWPGSALPGWGWPPTPTGPGTCWAGSGRRSRPTP